jgi:hypothetical protein
MPIASLVDDARKVRLATAETIFGLSWFLLDGGWLMAWKPLSYPCILIAVVSAGARFLWLERERVAMHVAASECAWLAMNAFWIIEDFESIPWCKTTAKVCLLLGLVILARAFFISRGEIQNILFRPIRRLRLMFQSEPKV